MPRICKRCRLPGLSIRFFGLLFLAPGYSMAVQSDQTQILQQQPRQQDRILQPQQQQEQAIERQRQLKERGTRRDRDANRAGDTGGTARPALL